MTKKLTFGLILCLGVATTAFAQQGSVGINTTDPAAPFDVVATTTDATVVDGVIAPRLTGNELKAKDAVYLGPQTGALVYATAAASPTTAKTINVTSAGYYYFDGAIWQKVANPTLATGDTTDDEWINNTASTRIELGKTSAKAARAAGAEFVALDNGNVGIGLTGPGTKLEITSTGTNNPLKLNNLQTGANTDKILTVDGNGNVRQVTPAAGVVGILIQSGNVQGTNQVDIPVGSTSDIPGATFSISPTVNVRLIIATSALPLPLNQGSPVQGTINLNQQIGAGLFTVVASQYYSATDAPLPQNGLPFVNLGNYSTITRVVDLVPGTYNFKLSAKSWYNTTSFNRDPLNSVPPYNGATAADANAMKASITYQVFTR